MTEVVDAHLAGIATQAPTTLEELAGCTVIGPTKLERYGDEIIAVIAELSVALISSRESASRRRGRVP
ncbi:MAG TPA: HRDC domain-containing protein [Acidimicrobiia bacterium]|nr:HRDC domain-containing protein [Acidimicrobiia bacterium]